MSARLLQVLRWLKAQSRRFVLVSAVPLVAAGLCGLVFVLWLLEHDEHVRQGYELRELKKQTTADVAALRAQAELDIREANEQRAGQIRELQAREHQLSQRAEELRGQIGALATRERERLEQVTTLPASELTARVANQLGLAAPEESPSGRPTPGAAGLAKTGGPARRNSAGGAGGPPPPAALAGRGAETQAIPAPPVTPPSLELNEGGIRKVEAALVELDSCRERGSVMNQQIEACNQEGANRAAIISQQAASIEKLNQALRAKDEILVRREAEHQAELRAAQGSRWSRLKRTAEHVLIGVAIGIGVALR